MRINPIMIQSFNRNSCSANQKKTANTQAKDTVSFGFGFGFGIMPMVADILEMSQRVVLRDYLGKRLPTELAKLVEIDRKVLLEGITPTIPSIKEMLEMNAVSCRHPHFKTTEKVYYTQVLTEAFRNNSERDDLQGLFRKSVNDMTEFLYGDKFKQIELKLSSLNSDNADWKDLINKDNWVINILGKKGEETVSLFNITKAQGKYARLSEPIRVEILNFLDTVRVNQTDLEIFEKVFKISNEDIVKATREHGLVTKANPFPYSL